MIKEILILSATIVSCYASTGGDEETDITKSSSPRTVEKDTIKTRRKNSWCCGRIDNVDEPKVYSQIQLDAASTTADNKEEQIIIINNENFELAF